MRRVGTSDQPCIGQEIQAVCICSLAVVQKRNKLLSTVQVRAPCPPGWEEEQELAGMAPVDIKYPFSLSPLVLAFQRDGSQVLEKSVPGSRKFTS